MDRDSALDDIVKSYQTIQDEESKKILIYNLIYNLNRKKLNISTKQLNISFQDIIYNTHNQWQIGYTGTAYLSLNDYGEQSNVFKMIDKDPDETIEILLALTQYGTTEKTPIQTISGITSNEIISNIVTYLITAAGTPRGLVDLAGIFVKEDNHNIAGYIKQNIEDSEIVYLNDRNKPVIYPEKNLFKNPNPNTFYYYDQGHIVGTDIKQPQTGHFAVICNRKIKISEFAQAIFRFRKLNRGTYMTIFMSDDMKVITVKELYNILVENERVHNEDQKMGLKYQLLKTMVRSCLTNRNYEENDLIPEFLEPHDYTHERMAEIIKNNIRGLLESTDNPIIQLLKRTILDNTDNMLRLLTGNYTVMQSNVQTNVQTNLQTSHETQTNINQMVQTKINYDMISIIKKPTIYCLDEKTQIPIKYELTKIKNHNCKQCMINISTKMFQSDLYKISGCSIYISYNFFTSRFQIIEKFNMEHYKYNKNIFDNDRFCFVKFETYVLIEIESFALLNYVDKYPIYDFYGYPINFKYILSDKLHFDDMFGKLLGLPDFHTNVSDHKQLNECATDLTQMAKILLLINFNQSTVYRLNISNQLTDILKKELDIISENYFPLFQDLIKDYGYIYSPLPMPWLWSESDIIDETLMKINDLIKKKLSIYHILDDNTENAPHTCLDANTKNKCKIAVIIHEENIKSVLLFFDSFIKNNPNKTQSLNKKLKEITDKLENMEDLSQLDSMHGGMEQKYIFIKKKYLLLNTRYNNLKS